MAAAFDLDAELSKGREDARRGVERERDNVAGALAASLDRKQAPGKAALKAAGFLRRAMKMVDESQVSAAKAAGLCLKAIETAPDFALAHHAMAISLERLGRLSTALGFYQRAYELDPGDPEVFLNLGMLAWKLDMLEAAEKFLRLHLQMAPNSKPGVMNLAGLLRDTQKFADSVELLRTQIYADDQNPELWNSLGTTLLESGDPEQAATFYRESLRLKPDYDRAHHNLAFCLDLMGDLSGSIEHFRTALSLGPRPVDQVTMEHGLSLALLADGQLAEGWDLYKARLSPHYKSCVNFQVRAPYWDGADPAGIKGKRLLLIGEQGIGDEIMHAGALDDALDAVGPHGAVALVCEKRLVEIFRRSVPGLAAVSRHATIFKEGKQIRSVLDAEKDFKPDCWAPLGNLQRAFRASPDRFTPAGPHLSADPARIAGIKAQVDALPPGLRVGFCWKSKLMKGNRTKYFSPFEMWSAVLKTPGCTFVSLQYGDVDAELKLCAEKYGVTIHQIEGLDLMDDLEGVGVLGAALDISVGQLNASLALTDAYGGETLILAHARKPWTSFGTGRLPWLPRASLFAPDRFGDWASPIDDIAADLRTRAAAARKGAA